MTDKRKDSRSPKIALIGGGTGSFTLLTELKEFTPHITALVNMSDNGGSTGKLRDELGVLPPGDVRQCLVALSDTPEVRDLFSYRFGQGSLAGQSMGNIILSGLELQHGSFARAIKVASVILHIKGNVIPITLDNHNLVMHDGSKIIKGEDNVGHHTIKNKNCRIELDPKAKLNPEAAQAISEADLVVIAPGNLYASLLPALAVEGMADALANTNAKVVAVGNLVTKPGQTDGWHIVDYVKEFEKYIGEGQIDAVLYNTATPSKRLLEKYAAEGEFPVGIEEDRFEEISATPIGSSLVAKEIAKQDSNDQAIQRTLIRHDGYQVGRKLMATFYE
jgi:uncharacterized cofD-like protein